MDADGNKEEVIEWITKALRISLIVGDDRVVRLRSIQPADSSFPVKSHSRFFNGDASLPLAEIRLAGEGNEAFKTSKTLVGGYTSTKLKYHSHQTFSTTCPIGSRGTAAVADHLEVESHHQDIKLSTTVRFTVFEDIPVLRSQVMVHNQSDEALVLSQTSSLVVGNLSVSVSDWSRAFNLSSSTNSWFREAQWHDKSLASVGLGDVGLYELDDGHRGSYAVHSVTSRGGFSTGTSLPMGILKRKDGGETWLWQLEHNGSWKWDIGDYQDSLYVAASGPTGFDHGCWLRLAPGKSYEAPPAAICHVFSGLDVAFAALTQYRRRIRRQFDDNESQPVIFNDFMNCLMGDPNEDKIAALLDPAVKAGAEYYVIDAGWFAESDKNWWDSVGVWEPDPSRFPSGFKNTIDAIKGRGLKVGLWLEPEVVGIRSPVSSTLPEGAFFQDHGSRFVERERYHLDYRHHAVIKHMNTLIDNLVQVYGIDYFKFDYNIEIVLGTDAQTETESIEHSRAIERLSSPSHGAGHLGHARAYLSWIEGLYNRHPALVIENCSSGGQRMDYATLAIHSLQSTSDQQDPVRYSAVAAGIPTAVTPEQGASWAYPQPDWSDEINALTVVNSLLGRVHLSGRLDLLSEAQMKLVSEGVRVYKEIRQDLRLAVPFWPLGLPKWYDEWLALGMKYSDSQGEAGFLLAVWRRGGAPSCNFPIPQAKNNSRTELTVLYPPSNLHVKAHWLADEGNLTVELPSTICARLFLLRNA
ncbi:hypothetical protein S7711_10125 [Stachybotrys chartarum IBT 7711]|uniref:alpha-galactosidase n=1 Tax=Stachybotrys chartarum (strain CBS 109288 / IBT 7711) TaxID=1280523 RepID=A0A084ANE2_STACB|nr:hypothetical protein S7711_10125 [Stachybotrys chartarum IBT 7711]